MRDVQTICELMRGSSSIQIRKLHSNDFTPTFQTDSEAKAAPSVRRVGALTIKGRSSNFGKYPKKNWKIYNNCRCSFKADTDATAETVETVETAKTLLEVVELVAAAAAVS